MIEEALILTAIMGQGGSDLRLGVYFIFYRTHIPNFVHYPEML
jgi:hypothetical protein